MTILSNLHQEWLNGDVLFLLLYASGVLGVLSALGIFEKWWNKHVK